MPNQNQTNNLKPTTPKKGSNQNVSVIETVLGKVLDANNILIALSSDPSVDDMATAIGLSLCLDQAGKHTTAIYSGVTPNALKFLKPEETFEASTDSLQDFVIALNKDKADHLRYKLDGDYVKIFITPYRSRISEEDLEFSYGDFNIDLVIAINVANGVDLDSALREHGRVMHDASIVNVTTRNPGKFGEVEWSDKNASSIAEMVSRLIYASKGKLPIDKDEATAFLTGIVAATDHFTESNTTATTLQVAAKLMESGADQQLVSKNITIGTNDSVRLEENNLELSNQDEQETKNPDEITDDSGENPIVSKADDGSITISHSEEPAEPEPIATMDGSDLQINDKIGPISEPNSPGEDVVSIAKDSSSPVEEMSSPEASVSEETKKEPLAEPQTSLDEDLRAAAASLANAGAEATPEQIQEPLRISSEGTSLEPQNLDFSAPPSQNNIAAPGSNFQPSSDSLASLMSDPDGAKYGQMLEEALAASNSPVDVTPAPITSGSYDTPISATQAEPIINGVPEENTATPIDSILPPPPAPPVDFGAPLPDTATPLGQDSMQAATPTAVPIMPAPVIAEQPQTPLGPQPSMQDQVYAPQSSNPGAFKIPGIN